MSETIQSQRTKVFRTLFQGYDGPPFSIRLWDGWRWRIPGSMDPACTLAFDSADALHSLIARPSELTLGEAFLSKDIEVDGDIVSAFAVAEHVFHCSRGQRQRILEAISGILFGIGQGWKMGGRHSPERDRLAISYHYDQSVDFYRPWLGESLTYSCGYFRSGNDSIDTAQTNKLDLICRKLRLKASERFLDIGCGWGSLILHAALRHHARAEGITLSQKQARFAKAQIAAARLTEECQVGLLDYREAQHWLGPFDKIASVGMFEHVGLKHLPQYFRTAYKLLRPGGVFLNHGIARSHSSLDRSIVPFLRNVLHLPRPQTSSFIDKYVFPDGELVTLSHALQAAESAGFEIRDVENLREHYELTLRHWIEGLRKNADLLLKHVSETTYRIWLLYMAGSAAAFRRGDIGVYQVLLSRPKRGDSQLPLTREDWYAPRFPGQEAGEA